MNRYIRTLWLIFTLLLLVACAPVPANAPTQSEAAPSGPAIVRIGWPGSPDSLNPGMGLLTEAYTVWDLVYDSLYDLQFDGTTKLSLAESVTASADGTVHTFTIRPGYKFHDGQPLTAKDVAFSLNFYKNNPAFPFLNYNTTHFTKIEATDDSTVVLTLDQAIPTLDNDLLYLFILPEHIWKDHAEGNAASEYPNLELIGSGPFKLKEYKQNEFVHLIANPEHPQFAPKIDEVVFQTFGNKDALVQALATGQVDAITEFPNTAIPVLRRTENVKLVSGPPIGPSVRDIIMNQVAPENCPAEAGKCSGHPALRDRNVRLALAHATNKQEIIDVAIVGMGKPGLTLMASGQAYWFNDQLQDYAFDIAKANQILDDAGYKDTDGDGVRQLSDGSQPLIFRLQWPNDVPEAPRIAELLGQTWAQIGIKTEPQSMDPDALTAVCCPAFDFDVMIWGWSWTQDPSGPLSVMRTDQISTGSSETGYANPDYDQLDDQQSVELDKEKRRELVFQMQEIVHNDVVYIIPYYQDSVQAYRTDRFTGWIIDAPTLELSDPANLTTITAVQ